MVEIYSIGHSNREWDVFLGLLKEYGIKVIVDVRRFPTSKKVPHFKRENLEKNLPENGLKYKWMGDVLGGFRKGGYRAYIETEEFQKGLEELIATTREKTAIMCAEKFPWRCHRRYISMELQKRGIKCIHIIEKGKIWIPKS